MRIPRYSRVGAGNNRQCIAARPTGEIDDLLNDRGQVWTAAALPGAPHIRGRDVPVHEIRGQRAIAWAIGIREGSGIR